MSLETAHGHSHFTDIGDVIRIDAATDEMLDRLVAAWPWENYQQSGKAPVLVDEFQRRVAVTALVANRLMERILSSGRPEEIGLAIEAHNRSAHFLLCVVNKANDEGAVTVTEGPIQ